MRLPDGRLMIQTLDFFTPIVDDGYAFGAIAAANALSDVYAMGGAPATAMNIVCWPHTELPASLLGEIMRGGADKVREAGAILVGGHSVRDPELKYGLSITGFVDADRLWTNAGAQPGDALVLTKPLGTGILSTAMKRGRCPEDAGDAAIAAMLTLNRAGRDAAAAGVVHACTDVTGFGLAGHGWEIARASGVRLVIQAGAVPLLPGVMDAAREGLVPGGARNNRAYVGDALEWGDVEDAAQAVMIDPQTSGGLLLSLPEADAERVVAAGVGVRIGHVEAGPAAIRFE